MPTVLLATEPFAGLARDAAVAYELPEARRVIVPHPLGAISPTAVEAKAVDAAADVVALLTPPAAG